MSSQVPSCWCVHDDHWCLKASLDSFREAGPRHVFVSRLAWNGTPGNWERCATIAQAAGADVVVGDWPDESIHRRASLNEMKRQGYRHLLIPDGDEVVDAVLLDVLTRIASADVSDLARVRMDTYWKSPRYVIRPREDLAPILLLNCQTSEHLHIREYTGTRPLLLGHEHGVLHHGSYLGPDERISRKISTWGHRNEVASDWFERVWKPWDDHRFTRDLHPTHPRCFGIAERIEPPACLSQIEDSIQIYGDPPVPSSWPKVSIIIPLYGGEEDIAALLGSLELCRDLLHEVIVVDDLSPDGAAEVAATFAGVRMVRNEENVGFGASCNRGYAASSGDIVIFLNSDTVVPRAGLIRLVESILKDPAVAAAGPCTNNAGYHHAVTTTYTSLNNLDGFAQDFAHQNKRDLEVNMLVGFCLAVRRSVLEQIGCFDERFGVGMFEDNDLCYRMLRAKHRLIVSTRAFVHHTGSQSLFRRQEHPTRLLGRNRQIFNYKWKFDLECGFASHLSGSAPEPIIFNHERHPDLIRAEIESKKKQADISLCMIVRNEERVIRQCLESAKPYFSQIVVVDTGSQDRTREICRDLGAEVQDFPWTDSFSEARNESLRHATGKWCFWLDADDTLPSQCGDELLRVALQAPAHATAFVVPVQFVESGPGGTRVDHVKLFRNHPAIRFEFRIHEQNLASLRALGGEIMRCNAYVLHSGYDTSIKGQAHKRERDYRLLMMDLREHPEHPFVLFNLGMTDHFTAQHARAVVWLERCLRASGPSESHVRKAYAMLSGSLQALGRYDEALDCVRQGLAAVGEDAELRFRAGALLADAGRYEEARAEYLAMKDDDGAHFSSVDVSIFGCRRFHNLGVISHALGDYHETRAWWVKALEPKPLFLPTVDVLFQAALDFGDFKTAKQVMELVRSEQGSSELWATLGSKLAIAMGGEEEGEAFLRRAADAEPQLTPARLVLVRMLLRQGREEEALPHLDQLQHNGVAEAAFYIGVAASKAGQLEFALQWMEKAQLLNPEHEETRQQITALRQLLQLRQPIEA